ncbi:MAG: methionyl-tRNA formyltransferase, partial [Patescibacteria group bacterium]
SDVEKVQHFLPLLARRSKNPMANNSAIPRFVFFGTPKVASDTLAVLIERGFVPAIVVTSPDAPSGRGLSFAQSETKSLALAHGLEVITPDTLDEKTIADMSALKCDYAIVVAYGKIFPEVLINTFPRGVLNVHYSLLPKYRGATPVEAALLAGDTTTGVTIQKMAKKLDAGDIVAQETTEIGKDEGARKLRTRLISIGANLLARTIPDYLSGVIVPVPQDHTRATFTKKIIKEDGLLDLAGDPLMNYKKIKALDAYFFTLRNGKPMRVRIVGARYHDNTLVITRVVPEGKKEMSYDDFLRGEHTRVERKPRDCGDALNP